MLGNTLLISEKETIRKRTAENYWYYLKKLLNTEKIYDSAFCSGLSFCLSSVPALH